MVWYLRCQVGAEEARDHYAPKIIPLPLQPYMEMIPTLAWGGGAKAQSVRQIQGEGGIHLPVGAHRVDACAPPHSPRNH